jgi:hypothetical protein
LETRPLQWCRTCPKYTANVGLDYNHALNGQLSLVGHADYTYTGQRYDLVAINQGQMWSLPGYGLANLRIGVKSEFGLECLAVLHESGQQSPGPGKHDGAQSGQPRLQPRPHQSQPRTIGLDFSFKH